jgi:magnesium chelatase subunit I
VIGDSLNDNEYEELLLEIIDARTIIDKYVKDLDDNDKFFFIEFILWGLESFNKLSILRTNNGIEFKILLIIL